MFFDYTSLLVATGVAAAATGLTFLVSWLSDKTIGFLAICSAAMMSIAAAISLFLYFTATFDPFAGFFGCAFLMLALSLGLAGAQQYRHNRFSPRRTLFLALGLVAATGLPYALGFDGLAFVFINLAAAVLLAIMAVEYWQCRRENPATIIGVVGLYSLLSVSFAACGGVLISESPLVLSGPPDNWAESANLMISVLGVTGIGALSVALNHQRLVKRHRDAARTDPLTGLWNRRALFDLFQESGLAAGAAIVIFDLDRFKSINDAHGHAVGDKFLVMFADILKNTLRRTDFAGRLGGEEFVVVLPAANLATVLVIAETIRLSFAKRSIENEDGVKISATVSVGLHANSTSKPQNFDDALRSADTALYRAKEEGRNLVRVGQHANAA